MSDPITDLADDRLVISLDFGTTFSGVAYAFNTPGKKADIVAIKEWPGELYSPSSLENPLFFTHFSSMVILQALGRDPTRGYPMRIIPVWVVPWEIVIHLMILL